jgi:hypothetical protein
MQGVLIHGLLVNGELDFWVSTHHKLMKSWQLDRGEYFISFHNIIKDKVLNELHLKRVSFFITLMTTQIFRNCQWMHYIPLFGFLFSTFNRVGLSFALDKILWMFVQQMFFHGNTFMARVVLFLGVL